MKNYMLFLMTLFLSCHVMAQQATVPGTITDGTDGCPLIGANVLAGICGACLPKGHNRKVDEVFYFKVGGKSRHAVYA